MYMLTRVQKWGNSQGLRLPKHVLEQADIGIGESVEIIPQDGQIVVKKTRKRKFDLLELVSRMPSDYDAREEDFGKPVGREEW